MRKQFKDTVLDLAATDDRIVVILGDISAFLFRDFKEKYPDRFFNMGILENTLISVCAGLSSQGFYPFVHTIAPFITERSFEQIKLDLCYNRFGGNIVSCGASFDYAWDGPTHHAYTDLAILRLLPGMEVLQPGSETEADTLIRSCYNNGHPTYYRLSDNPHDLDIPVTFGRANVLLDRNAPITIMTAGPLLKNVMEGCRDLPVNLVYFTTIKPLDVDVMRRFQHTQILIIHDAYGLREAVSEATVAPVRYLGLRDEFCCWYGKVGDTRRELGLDPEGIRLFVQSAVTQLSGT